MSTAILRIIQLVNSLPPEEQEYLRLELSRQATKAKAPQRMRLLRNSRGEYFNPEGLPNDDPVFKVLDEIEERRHQTPGPPAPELV